MKPIIIIALLFTTSRILSQSKGYFGKNNIIEISIHAQNPSLYNYKISTFPNIDQEGNTPYIKKNNSLTLGHPKINYGFNLSIGHMLKRNVGIYLESGMSFFSVVADQNAVSVFNFNKSKYTNLNAEMIKIQAFSIIPKIEISSKDGLLPIGISNQFGFGLNLYKPIEKEYLGTVDYSGDTLNKTGIPITKNNLYNYSNTPIKGYTLLYKLALRIPISKSLLFHFGFRYTFNFIPNSSYKYNQNEILSQDNMRKMIKLKENRNLLNFETGIAFCF